MCKKNCYKVETCHCKHKVKTNKCGHSVETFKCKHKVKTSKCKTKTCKTNTCKTNTCGCHTVIITKPETKSCYNAQRHYFQQRQYYKKYVNPDTLTIGECNKRCDRVKSCDCDCKCHH
jgi:hypothetical protein